MKASFTLQIVLGLSSLFVSCNLNHCLTKSAFLESYDTFVEEVEKLNQDGNQDWTNVDKDFKDFMEVCYKKFKEEMSVEEKKTVWKKTFKFYYNRYDGDFGLAYKDAKQRFSADFKQDLDQILKSGDQDIRDVFSDLFKEDLKSQIDEILNSLNDWGEKLKKGIEEMDK